MCIIIYKPQGTRLLPSTVEGSFENNPDGAGFMYSEDGKLHMEKGFFKLQEFNEAFEPHKLKQAVLHFRIRTQGDIDQANCHPFSITDNIGFAHNGIISAMPDDKHKSDTYLFNDLLLKGMARDYGERMIWDSRFLALVSRFVAGSKLVFLSGDGKIKIINESFGDWKDGCWFSNNSWEKRKKYKSQPAWKWDQEMNVWRSKTDPNTILNKDGSTTTIYPMTGTNTKKGTNLIPFNRKPMTKAESKTIKKMQNKLQFKKDDSELPDRVSILTPEGTKIVTRNFTSDVLKVGDYVRFSIDFHYVSKDSLAKVLGVYGNGEIEVFVPMGRKTVKVPPIYLEKLYEAPDTPELAGNLVDGLGMETLCDMTI